MQIFINLGLQFRSLIQIFLKNTIFNQMMSYIFCFFFLFYFENIKLILTKNLKNQIFIYIFYADIYNKMLTLVQFSNIFYKRQ